jgi:hypothetical protein
MFKQKTIERFYSNIFFNERIFCWEWKGLLNGDGYGVLKANNKTMRAHKFSYILHMGDVPEHKELDHLCCNKMCCNPEHLEAVTHRENVLRGLAPSAINYKKTHCKRGHILEGDNLYKDKDGGRECRICRKTPQLNRPRRLEYFKTYNKTRR